jgi:protein gp37
VGATVDTQERVQPTEDAMRNVSATVKFVSCEPLLEPIKFNEISLFDWVIIGSCSKTTNYAEFQPKWRWVAQIMKQAQCNGINIPIYFKPNMKARPKEYPAAVSNDE